MSTSGGSFVDWLIGDGGAGWIVGVLTLGTWGVTYARRKRPNRIAVRVVARDSLVRIRALVKNDIKIEFTGKTVANLGLTELEIRNMGSDVIRDVSIRIHFQPSTKILEAFPWRDGAPTIERDVKVIPQDDSILLVIPFLNPSRELPHVIQLTAIVDGDSQPLTVHGNGPGWCVDYLPLETASQTELPAHGIVWLFTGVAAGAWVYATSSMQTPYLAYDKVNWKLLAIVTLATTVVMASMDALMNWLTRRGIRKFRRFFKF